MSTFDGKPELPDLEEFARRMEAAAQATESFTEAVGQTAPQQGGQPQAQQQQQDSPVMRDILNALHLIHDEAVQIRTILERLTQ
jgi:hypothetical protein